MASRQLVMRSEIESGGSEKLNPERMMHDNGVVVEHK